MSNLKSLNGWAEKSGYISRTSAQSFMNSDTVYRTSTGCGSSCGAKDGEDKPKPSACGAGESEPKPSACGAGDSSPKPSACGAGDSNPKPSACGAGGK